MIQPAPLYTDDVDHDAHILHFRIDRGGGVDYFLSDPDTIGRTCGLFWRFPWRFNQMVASSLALETMSQANGLICSKQNLFLALQICHNNHGKDKRTELPMLCF